MSKVRILGIAMFAVFAFSAITAASAFAADEFLFEGNVFAGALATNTAGSLTLEATILGIKAVVDCSGLFEGSVVGGVAKLAEITDAFDLAGNLAGELEDSTAAISCEALAACNAGELVSVWVDNLSLTLSLTWDLPLLLEGTEFILDFPAGSGFEVECKTPLGTVNVLCSAPTVDASLTNEVGGILALLLSNELVCNNGATNGKVSGEGLIEHTGGGTLSVS